MRGSKQKMRAKKQGITNNIDEVNIVVNPQIIPGSYQPIAHLKDRHHGNSAEIRGFHTSALTTGFL